MDNAANDLIKKVKENRNLVETLKLLGAISGFLALLGSALTFIVINSLNIYKQLAWEERIRVLKCNSNEGYLITNIGDGEVYINDVSFSNDDTKNLDTYYIRKIVKPKELMEFTPKRNDMVGFVPALVDHEAWPMVFAAINHRNSALSMEYFLPGDPMLEKLIKPSAHEKPENLVTSNKGTATFNFYGTRTGRNHLKIAVVGIVYKKKDIEKIDLD